MKKVLISLLFGCFVFGMVLGVAAEEKRPDRVLWLIIEREIDPSMDKANYLANKEYVKIRKAYNFPCPIYVSREGNIYSFALPVGTYGQDSDYAKAVGAFWDRCHENATDEEKGKLAKIYKTFDEARVSVNKKMAWRRASLSYRPENPRLKSEEARVVYRSFYHVKQNKQMEFVKVVRQYIELCKVNEMADGFGCYEGAIGEDLPIYAFAAHFKNEEDLKEQIEKNTTEMGQKGKDLLNKAKSLCKKVEHSVSEIIPEISYYK